MSEVNQFEAVRLGIASPEQVLAWSYGEVLKPETINYRTLRAERDGLFCERIFGPTKDWECWCGKYKRPRYKGIVCDKCGVEVTRAKVRRERMGHIVLAAPVSHIWFAKSTPGRIGLVLDLTPRALDEVIYFAKYIVVDVNDEKRAEVLAALDARYDEATAGGATPQQIEIIDRERSLVRALAVRQLKTEAEWRQLRLVYPGLATALMGAEAILKLLKEIDLDALWQELRDEAENTAASSVRRKKAVKRWKVVDSLRRGNLRPEWMVLTVLPVLPPDLRPMVQLDGGRYATSDVNELYRRVLNRNNRLKKLLDLAAPEIIIRNEKRMLQEAVDALIDNDRRARPVVDSNGHQLKSLSDLLKGKQGRFRQNLLGKRVDYSGRSVIVVGPQLRIDQCGLPKTMALELFKPFVMEHLVSTGQTYSARTAKRMIEHGDPEVWDALVKVIRQRPVLLNRAPTLHRLGIQAFEPVLVEGNAIELPPQVCSAFNADFDGDQMAVHVPLSALAVQEARERMLSSHNVLLPSNGQPTITPRLEMVLGCYYLTAMRPGARGEGKRFVSRAEALAAYEHGVIHLQAQIGVRTSSDDGKPGAKITETTVGRLIFNEAVPSALGYINEQIDSQRLGSLIRTCFQVCDEETTVKFANDLKNLGFRFATQSGASIAISDLTPPRDREGILSEADHKASEIRRFFEDGLITEDERYMQTIQIWNQATERVQGKLAEHLDRFGAVSMMSKSGAKGNIGQIRQMSAMRGLMTSPSGRIIDLPVRNSFRDGLTVLEYFISTHGARKGLADTALRTADSGYLTRRLVDVAQDAIVREEDCGTSDGIWIHANATARNADFAFRLIGRYAATDVLHPTIGTVVVAANVEIDEEAMAAITEAGITQVQVRSPLTCHTSYGICQHCYGRDLARNRLVAIGEAVGIVAAQSIGEPGTQLTMRTFHTGGVAGRDITSGLPRIEEIFEARIPRRPAILSEIEGIVQIDPQQPNRVRVIAVTPDDHDDGSREYLIPAGTRVTVTDGALVQAGDQLCEGVCAPADILRISGKDALQQYLVTEVQRVYQSQGVNIHDKHVEVIAAQMLRRVQIESAGDTEFVPGEVVDRHVFEALNESILAAGGDPSTARPMVLGITRAALSTDSFLAAASFQETTKVLTQAAVATTMDRLVGLKENVILGKLVPAGTGYREIEPLLPQSGVSFGGELSDVAEVEGEAV